MSEEETEKPSGGGPGDGGSVLKKWGPLAAIVLVAQGIVAWGVITTVFKDRGGGDEHGAELLLSETQVQEGGNKSEHVGPLPKYFSDPILKKILANPAGTDASRVVMLSVELGLINLNEKPGAEEEASGGGEGETEDPDMAKLKPYVGKMRALVIELVCAKGIDELNDLETRKELAEEIRKKFNSQIMQRVYVPDKKDEEKKIFEVSEVIFSEFVIQ